MAKNDFSDLGKQIRDRVQKSVESMDFEKLSEDISQTVGKAMDEVKKTIHTIPKDFLNEKRYARYDHPYKANEETEKRDYDEEEKLPKPIIGSPKGNVAGVLYTVFGFIGVTAFGLPILAVLMAILAGTSYYGMSVALGFLLPCLAVFGVMAGRGICLNRRTRRFKRYVTRIGNKCLCGIRELSTAVNKPEKFVKKDVSHMIGLGMFPEGHMDEQQTCLILDDATYQLYLNSMETLQRRRQEQMQQGGQEEGQKETEDEALRELEEVIEAGNEYVRQIQEANSVLEEKEISTKLQRLEDVIRKIFEYVGQNPGKLPEIKRFTDYYLPTTLKLVRAYQKFDSEPIQGENIRKSKEEIWHTLDTINQAFENLLDSLYEDLAMDISTDISVLQTMLAQEGLTGNDFKKN